MVYSKQTFVFDSYGTSAQQNQTEDNISDHVHGQAGVSSLPGTGYGGGYNELLVYRVSVTSVGLLAQQITLKHITSGHLLDTTATSILIANITTAGLGGLDTGAEAADTWYYLYVISDTVSTNVLLSTSRTAPTMPSGYVYKRLIGAVRNDASSNFLNFWQYGNIVWYKPMQVLASGLSSITFAAQSMTTLVPFSGQFVAGVKYGGASAYTTTANFSVILSFDAVNAYSTFGVIGIGSGLPPLTAANAYGTTQTGTSYHAVDYAYIPTNSGIVYYKASAATINLTLYVRSYILNI